MEHPFVSSYPGDLYLVHVIVTLHILEAHQSEEARNMVTWLKLTRVNPNSIPSQFQAIVFDQKGKKYVEIHFVINKSQDCFYGTYIRNDISIDIIKSYVNK